MKVLVIEDNKEIIDVLQVYLSKEGFICDVALDGESGLEKFEEFNPDIILLDVMLPKINGYDVCKKIRRVSNVSIIMITARGEEYEKIMGLELGADDYIVKPFSPAEVIARIRAIMRRVQISTIDNELTYEDLVVNLDKYKVTVDNVEVHLTKKEFEILAVLLEKKEKVFSRDELLNHVWGYDFYGDNRTVDTHIKRLRSKFDDFETTWSIKTIWGVGYKFEVNNEDV